LVKKRFISQSTFYIHAAHHRLFAQHIEPASQRSVSTPTALVFLHEGLGSIPQWRDFPASLSMTTGLPALVYERWGYGNSDTLDIPRTVHYLHDEALITLPEVLQQLDITHVILIGHSDGGSIALMFAAIHGDNTQGVITEAAHVFVEEVTITGIRKAVEVYETTDLKSRLYQYHKDNTDPMFRGWAHTWLSKEFRNWSIEEYLPHITCPLLVLQGAQDEYGTQAQVDSVVSQVAGPVKGLMIPDCGHVPHHQAHERVLEEMTQFINSLIL